MLEQQINEDIKKAMKEGAKGKLDALRLLKSALIENKVAVKPRPEMDVLVAHYKKIKDSIESFPPGHAQVEKLKQEMLFLDAYMPQAMTEGEVQKIIAEILQQNPGANMGAVMKELSPQIKGRFDGKLANQLVQQALQKS
jgi:uncharacterized protein